MSAPANWTKTIVPGFLLGFTVASLGFADYNELHRMLLFRDLRLLLTFAFAVTLAIVGFILLRRRLKFEPNPWRPGLVPGAILFGLGWAITGACPGVALVQVGQGIWPAGASLAGIWFGIWLKDRIWPPAPEDASTSC